MLQKPLISILKNVIYRRNFTNKVRVWRATLPRRRPALPAPKQDSVRSRSRNFLKSWIRIGRRIRNKSFRIHNPGLLPSPMALAKQLAPTFDISDLHEAAICMKLNVGMLRTCHEFQMMSSSAKLSLKRPAWSFISKSAPCSQHHHLTRWSIELTPWLPLPPEAVRYSVIDIDTYKTFAGEVHICRRVMYWVYSMIATMRNKWRCLRWGRAFVNEFWLYIYFMYRRPTLYPLEIAVDFLKSP